MEILGRPVPSGGQLIGYTPTAHPATPTRTLAPTTARVRTPPAAPVGGISAAQTDARPWEHEYYGSGPPSTSESSWTPPLYKAADPYVEFSDGSGDNDNRGRCLRRVHPRTWCLQRKHRRARAPARRTKRQPDVIQILIYFTLDNVRSIHVCHYNIFPISDVTLHVMYCVPRLARVC